MRFEGRYDPTKILMIDAMFDDCMPESSRAALWEITGHPERVTFLYQHRSAFYSLTPLGLNVSRRKIYGSSTRHSAAIARRRRAVDITHLSRQICVTCASRLQETRQLGDIRLADQR